MKLDSVYIKNFRNINELDLKLSDFNILVGENSVGKTNILMAIFKILKMNESPYRVKFAEDDFYFDEKTQTRSKELIIKLNFSKLNSNDKAAFIFSGIDVENDKLSIMLEAKWEEDNNDAAVEIFFYREDDEEDVRGELFKLNDKKFIPFYYIDAYRDIWKETKTSNGELKQIFNEHNNDFLKPLDYQISACANEIDFFIRNNESEDPNVIKLLKELFENLNTNNLEFLNTLDLETDICSKIKNKDGFLKSFKKIDNIIYKKELDKKLKEVTNTVNEMDGIKKVKQNLIDNLSMFVPEINDLNIEIGKLEEYDLLDEKKISIGDFSILREGTGFQNSFVMALKLSRLISQMEYSDYEIADLIIIIEEPEAHMHPHLQRRFINNLIAKQKDLSNKKNIQFIITTHSPFILSQVDKPDICLIRKENQQIKTSRLNKEFFDKLKLHLKPKDIKHFDTIFRNYPEIFLTRGVIIVEGNAEYGAFPEFAQILGVDLDSLGITVINSSGIENVKPFYLILKEFSKPIAIRDNEPCRCNDDFLIIDVNEPYEKTKHKDFEEEILNSVNLSKILKLILQIDSGKASKNLINKLKEDNPKTFRASKPLRCWDTLNKNYEKNFVKEKFLKKCKNPLFWSQFAKELTENEIPESYKEIILKAARIVKGED